MKLNQTSMAVQEAFDKRDPNKLHSLDAVLQKYLRMESVLQACVLHKMPAEHGEGCGCFICSALSYDPLWELNENPTKDDPKLTVTSK